MTKVYKLEGLDCAHCAGKMETKISKLKGVDDVNVDFLTQKMIVDANAVSEELYNKMVEIIHHLEPQVVVKAL